MNIHKSLPDITYEWLYGKEIIVTNIESPSNFNVILNEHIKKYDIMKTTFQSFYGIYYQTLLCENLINLTFCCFFADSNWLRGKMLNFNTTTATLKRLDDGKIYNINMNLHKICYLSQNFCSLSPQNINLRLANIIPSNQKYWTNESLLFFKQFSLGQKFILNIKYFSNDLITVDLEDYDLMESCIQNLKEHKFGVHELHLGKIPRYFPIENY